MKILHDASYAHPAATEMSDEYRVVMVEQTKQPANSGLADVDVSTNVWTIILHVYLAQGNRTVH